ncbi:hypothetical protein [Nostoc sp. 'Peltigera malacea cyanobiont' DB3992]|nr:hypothetical protein [Nostoc sp. 'Peltigera malacea cyanobiont' DB3992]
MNYKSVVYPVTAMPPAVNYAPPDFQSHLSSSAQPILKNHH